MLKKRGYKSNREEASDKESGKVLTTIKENEKIMKDNNYRNYIRNVYKR